MPRARLARARSQRFERFVEQKKLFMAFRSSHVWKIKAANGFISHEVLPQTTGVVFVACDA